jgi:hypothetical protein
MAALIYGGGLRVSECCQLRVKDVDFDQGLVFVHSGKGDKDRSTLLAETGRAELRTHLGASETLHRADRAAGLAGVWMPDALDRKYPNAGRELGWFWVFPSQTLSTDPRVGVVRRHHVSDSIIPEGFVDPFLFENVPAVLARIIHEHSSRGSPVAEKNLWSRPSPSHEKRCAGNHTAWGWGAPTRLSG